MRNHVYGLRSSKHIYDKKIAIFGERNTKIRDRVVLVKILKI